MSTAGNQLLWAIIRDNKLETFSDLTRDFFTSNDDSGPSEKDLYDFIFKHKTVHGKLPSPGALNQNGFAYEDMSEPLAYYLHRIKQRTLRNKTINLQRKVNEVLKTNQGFTELQELIDNYRKDISDSISNNRFKTLEEIAKDFLKEIELSRLTPIRKSVPYGWPTLDNITNGMFGGDATYLVARPGIGKSSLAGAVSYHNYINGYTPLVFSMEMVDKSFAARVIGNAAGFNPNSLRTMTADMYVEHKLREFIQKEKSAQYYIAEGTFKQTPDTIADLINKVRPDVVFVDASYLVAPNTSNKAKWEKISDVAEAMKQVALAYDVPIFHTVQFNREAGKKKSFELENIAGGDAIGQLGSVVLSMELGEGVHEESRRKIKIMKNREGDLGSFQINFAFTPPDFSECDVTEEDDEVFYDDEQFKL
jgi:replicative DNA helicase